MSTPQLPTSPPSEQGVDARGIHALLDALEGAPSVEPHSLMVLRHGHVVAAGWWAPYSPDRVHLLYSLSKSFTSTAAGLAVAEDLLGLDDTVLSHFPEFDADITDPRSRAMLVRHVAAMASGHLTETLDRALAADPGEPVRGFLLTPPEREPGTVFAYNQPATYSLGAIVARESGQTLTEYLRHRLLDRIGIGGVGWKQYPPGRDMGFSGLHATTDAIARLGLLYLQQGQWDGEALLSKEWVAEASRSHIANPDEPSVDWQQGYGFQFWMSRHGYRGDGAYGQFALVLPEHDAVVAITGATQDSQLVLDAVWDTLLPAFGNGSAPNHPGDDAALATRLTRLQLPAVAAADAPPADPNRWSAAGLVPADGGNEQRSLEKVEIARHDGRWRLSLHEAGWEVSAPMGTGDWAVTEPADAAGVPVAVSGGWTGPDELRADILFLETPHRLTLTCSLSSGTFRARWLTAPLDAASLRDLAAPRPLG